jgi:hypothetical protein
MFQRNARIMQRMAGLLQRAVSAATAVANTIGFATFYVHAEQMNE